MNNLYKLSFISDEDLVNHVKKTIEEYGETLKSINLKGFNSNIVDPIKLTFDSKVYDKQIEEAIESEIIRQRDKTNNNSIGYFHQNIFKYIKNCFVPKEYWDVTFSNNKKSIVVEMKNKHNTMNSSSAKATFIKMQNHILHNPNEYCYLVEVISKKSQNIPWEITLDNKRVKHDQIRKVSIDKFYEEITENQYSFKKLCDVLPIVIDDVLTSNPEIKVESDTVIKELRRLDDNLLNALYVLAFKHYEGFNTIATKEM